MNKDNILTISEKLKNKSVSALDLYKKYSDNINKLDKKINAFREINLNWEKQAQLSDQRWNKNEQRSKFDGIPIAIKDNISTSEMKTCAGSKMLENYHSPYNATVIEKLLDLGFIIAGKTNMDEFAMGGSTETCYFGKTSNPIDLSRVPGGSSGGSAAAVSGGLVPISLGSDTGGSIRQPSSYCGTVGFKPSYGSVSRYGLLSMASSLDQIGPIANTVPDILEIFKIIAGQDSKDATSKNIDNFNKINNLINIAYDPSIIKRGLDKTTATVIKNLIFRIKKNPNYKINEISLPHLDSCLATYYIIMPAEVSSNMARYDGLRFGFNKAEDDYISSFISSRSQGLGKEVKRRILLGTYVLSAGYYDAYYKKAMNVRKAMIYDYKKILEKFDAILLPTSPSVAFKKGEKINDPMEMYLMDIYTVIANLTTLPAISFPKQLENELPVGIQLIGAWGKDFQLMDIAQKIDQEVLNG